MTGPVANSGRYYRDAYQLAIDKINDAGGVKVGIESHKLALKLYDNQSDVNLHQYTQLVSHDKVEFLFGVLVCSSGRNAQSVRSIRNAAHR